MRKAESTAMFTLLLLLLLEFIIEEEWADEVEDDDVILLSKLWFSVSENFPVLGDSESVLYLYFILFAIKWSANKQFSSTFLGEPAADDDEEDAKDKWVLLL